MKQPDIFELDIRSIQCTLEALDVVREAYETRNREEGISKREFAKWIGKDPSYVSRILNGRVSNVNYNTIARMLVALDYYPTLKLEELAKLSNLTNYKHCEDVEDVFVRASTSEWKELLNNSCEEEVNVSRPFSEPRIVNG